MGFQQKNIEVSIIIPCYNVVDYICDCIYSILNQTYKYYEIILIDDCGDDDSIEKAEKILNESTSVFKILHHEANKGLSAGRNTGVNVARGKYIFFMDSDDTIEPDCIRLLMEKAESTGVDMVVGNINIIGDSNNIPLLDQTLHNCVIKGNDAILNSYLANKWYVMAWNKLIRRKFIEQNNISFVEGLIHEDNPWSFEVACCAKKIAFIGDKTYNYLVRENSLQTGKDFTKHYSAYMTIMKIIADTITDKHVEKQARFWFERQKALFFSMTQENGSTQECKEMYGLIHKLSPNYSFSKENLHYFLPTCIAYYLYKKFYGYHLC